MRMMMRRRSTAASKYNFVELLGLNAAGFKVECDGFLYLCEERLTAGAGEGRWERVGGMERNNECEGK